MAEEQNRTLVLCSSCKKKRCPVVSMEENGDLLLSDVDQTEPGTVRLVPEQVEMLLDWLLQSGRAGDLEKHRVLSAQKPGFEGESAVDRTFRQGNL
jgi:hypothetical protein